MAIIKTPPEKRTGDDVYHLSVYLMDTIDYFKNDDFQDKDFMI